MDLTLFALALLAIALTFAVTGIRLRVPSLDIFRRLFFAERGALETIAEADKYSQSMLLRGVVETIIDVSPMFNVLPVMEVVGNSVTYLRETTLPTGEFFSPGDTWTEGTPVVTQVTAALKIAGKDADVDQFLARTRASHHDLEAEVIAAGAKSVARTIENELIYGDVDDINSKGFDGLHEILGVVTGAQDVLAGAGTTGGPGTFSKLDEMIDLVKPRADILMMGRRTLRQIRKLARSQGWDLALSSPGAINKPVSHYGDIPIFINDFMTITEDCVDGGFGGKTGDDTSSIFALHLGEDGLFLLDNGGLQVDDLGLLETKDARRRRIKWYVSLALKNTKAVARLSGIDTQDWTN